MERDTPEKIPNFNPHDGGTNVVGDVRGILDYEDVFNNLVAQRTNILDVASHYPYSPMRWRITVDGSRVFPEYGSISQYNHAGDVHELTPSGGETIVYHTAERPRYVVGFELSVTLAFSVNQSLTGDDLLRVGMYDGDDGYYLEHDGDHADDECDLVVERAGTVVERESDVSLHVPVTRFARARLRTPSYNIGRQIWDRSYSEDGEQKNPTIGTTSVDDGRGPTVGNLPPYFEIQADSSTSGLQLNAGSVSMATLDSTTPLTRDGQIFERETISTTGEWVPHRAFRVGPDRDTVNVQVEAMSVRETGTGEDVFVLLQSFASSKALDSNDNELSDGNFTAPPERQEQSTAIQENGNVAKIADGGGTVTTSTTDPGGYQIAGAAIHAGSGEDASQQTVPRGKVKRPLWPDEIGVILIKSSSTGDLAYDITFEEDW